MDFTLSKEHEMARTSVPEISLKKKLSLLHRKLTRQSISRERPLRKWLRTASWEFRFRRNTADRAAIRSDICNVRRGAVQGMRYHRRYRIRTYLSLL